MTDRIIDPTTGRGLGRLPAIDPRDRAYSMRSLLATPPVKTYRHYRIGPILDQGATSSCVGHAWAQWAYSAPVMTRPGASDADPYYVYREAQYVDEWPGAEPDYFGTSVRAGAKVLEAAGYIASYVWSWDAAAVRDWLLSDKGTVVLGTAWYGGMSQPDPIGTMTPTGDVLGGHAYLCAGYAPGRGFRIVNSWGSTYGKNGRAWLPFHALDYLLGAMAGEACAAVQAAP